MTGPISRHGCVVKKEIGKRNLCSMILQTLVKISKLEDFFRLQSALILLRYLNV